MRLTIGMRPLLTIMAVIALAFAAIACGAALQQQAQESLQRQEACVAEAGTLAESRACKCKVRADYPGPQCDGGVTDAGKDSGQ